MSADYTSIIISASVTGFIVEYAFFQYQQYKHKDAELSNLSKISDSYAIKESERNLKTDGLMGRIFCLGDRTASRRFMKSKAML